MTQAHADTLAIIEKRRAVAVRRPDCLIQVSYRNYFVYNAHAKTLFAVNYNAERDVNHKWDLINQDTGETLDSFRKCNHAATAARHFPNPF